MNASRRNAAGIRMTLAVLVLGLLAGICRADDDPKAAATFHVGPEGRDNWSGTLASPNARGNGWPIRHDRPSSGRRPTPPCDCPTPRARRRPAPRGPLRAERAFGLHPRGLGHRREPDRLRRRARRRGPGRDQRRAAVTGWKRGARRARGVGRGPSRAEGRLAIPPRLGRRPMAGPPPAPRRRDRHVHDGRASPAPTRRPRTTPLPTASNTPPARSTRGWTGLRDVEVVVVHFWIDSHLKIAAVEPDRRVVTLDRTSHYKFTDEHQAAPGRYYVTNVYEALGPAVLRERRGRHAALHAARGGVAGSRAMLVAPRLASLVEFRETRGRAGSSSTSPCGV